jgi:rhodanese-related sulfurtransferase/DNA-binding transcriptional ArsR family regulator
MNIRMYASDPNTPYRVIAELGRVLSSPQRVRLLHLLCQCDRTVEELAGAMNESVANVSHHLQLLKKSQLVVSHRLDRRIAYGLADEEVAAFWRTYRDFCSERLPELRVVWGELAEKRRALGGSITRADLVKLLKQGEVVLIDVRPREEYEAGHITGAISIPHSELMDRLQELPRHKKIVLYCRGPYCLLGDAVQEKLANKLIKSLRLADGTIDWKGAGLPIRRAPGFKPLIKRNEP